MPEENEEGTARLVGSPGNLSFSRGLITSKKERAALEYFIPLELIGGSSHNLIIDKHRVPETCKLIVPQGVQRVERNEKAWLMKQLAMQTHHCTCEGVWASHACCTA